MSAACFSDNYTQARQRFLAAARDAGAQLSSHAVSHPSPPPLAIDVATIGAIDAPAMVISSGIHGIEGLFGSAVQLALLQQLRETTPSRGLRWVLIHALNPYGFAHLRRVNEDNVDLNRNFIPEAGQYRGAPAGYDRLDSLLNPASPPSRLEPFWLKAIWHIQRTGLPALKAIVAGGQYEYPRGLFYGGHGPCASTRIVQQHCADWLGSSQHILHIDLHSGLGRYARPLLLLNDAPESERHAWHVETFGTADVQPLTLPQGAAYPVTGMLGLWLQRRFASRDYRFAGVEIGTYHVVRVLAALRAENRAHHHCSPDDAAWQRAKLELAECFAPRAQGWRDAATRAALQMIRRGADALLRLDG